MSPSRLTPALVLESSYPSELFARSLPTPVAAPDCLVFNAELARSLNLDVGYLAGPEGVEILVGNRLSERCVPVAMAYAGHQFGRFSPMLGDGRAVLLGEVVDADGNRRDLQLKGSGRTPFTRGGDGRSTLASVLREYLISEAMAALGIPTTRALAAVATGEVVLREASEPGGVLTRVARSHIRIGSFQFLSARGNVDGLRRLADHMIARHYPEAAGSYRALLNDIVIAQARLVARWASVGFVHGVMNTDNMSIAAETIDYGPCAFLDHYDPDAVFSSIDHEARYAYGNQPHMAAWNLARLAEAMLSLLAEREEEALCVAQEAIDGFAPAFRQIWLETMGAKIGLRNVGPADAKLIEDLLALMSAGRADFTLTFRRLADAINGTVSHLHADLGPGFLSWHDRWRQRTVADALHSEALHRAMLACNPAVIPRNHHVNSVLRSAVEDGDMSPFLDFLKRLATPFDDGAGDHLYGPPLQHEMVVRTFCGI